MTGILTSRDEDTNTQREDHVMSQGEVGQLQAKERGLRRNLLCLDL